MSQATLPAQYARLLRPHARGYALYFPVPEREVQPGALGFFDDKGRWQTLLSNVQNAEFPFSGPPPDVRSRKSAPLNHPVMYSQGIGKFNIDLKAALE